MVENYPVLSISERYGNLLLDGNGGISAAGIKMALDSEGWISDIEKPELIRKLVLYLTTAIKTSNQHNKDKPHGQKNPSRSSSKR